ncbi:MAG TPA: hypothetical protein VFW07_10160 [Parafilimonas sp.]|nr:hypothetical protein [Parafilimonas sp.]
MAERKIKIFKTFEEQEAYHLDWMLNSSPKERFAALFRMQQFTNRFHKPASDKRAIIIHNGSSK